MRELPTIQLCWDQKIQNWTVDCWNVLVGTVHRAWPSCRRSVPS